MAPRRFTVHRRKNPILINAVFVGLIAVETFALHLIIARWTQLGAWIATASSASAALWLLADCFALARRGVAVGDETVAIAIGRRWRVEVPRRMITGVTPCEAVPDGAVNLALLEPTVLVELAGPVTVQGPLGLKRRGARLALTIDDAEGFIAAVGAGAAAEDR